MRGRAGWLATWMALALPRCSTPRAALRLDWMAALFFQTLGTTFDVFLEATRPFPRRAPHCRSPFQTQRFPMAAPQLSSPLREPPRRLAPLMASMAPLPPSIPHLASPWTPLEMCCGLWISITIGCGGWPSAPAPQALWWAARRGLRMASGPLENLEPLLALRWILQAAPPPGHTLLILTIGVCAAWRPMACCPLTRAPRRAPRRVALPR